MTELTWPSIALAYKNRKGKSELGVPNIYNTGPVPGSSVGVF